MEIKAPRDMVIVKVHYKNTLNDGKVIIPVAFGTKQNTMEYYGEVVAVGPDYLYEVDVGDKIFFSRNEGTVIKVDGEEYHSLKPRAILCKYTH